MKTKNAFFSPLGSINNHTVGYEKFSQYLVNKNENSISITWKGNPVTLTLLGKGGSKLIYDMQDGYAVALPNLNSNAINVELWERIVQEEISMSLKLQQAGLYTQIFEKTTLHFDGHPIQTCKMPSFEFMASHGQQIRDSKNSNDKHGKYGSSMLFGNLDNIQSRSHWENILEGFQQDLVTYYSHGLAVGGDSFNLCIADSPMTPPHDRSVLDVFSNRNQKVHFCFYDFSSKHQAYSETKYSFLDLDGNIVPEAIEEEIGYIFSRVEAVITLSPLPEEYVNIFGGITNLLLLPADAILNEIPEKTIVLQKAGDHISARFMNKANFCQHGRVDLSKYLFEEIVSGYSGPKLLELEQAKQITINEHKGFIRGIADLCRCKQYSETMSALNISELAKPVLQQLKPLFIKAVTDKVVENLEQLSTGERQDKFDVYKSQQEKYVL